MSYIKMNKAKNNNKHPVRHYTSLETIKHWENAKRKKLAKLKFYARWKYFSWMTLTYRLSCTIKSWENHCLHTCTARNVKEVSLVWKKIRPWFCTPCLWSQPIFNAGDVLFTIFDSFLCVLVICSERRVK